MVWAARGFFIATQQNKPNLRHLIAATGLVIATQIGLKSSIFQRVWPSNLIDDFAKQYGTCSMLCQALCIVLKSSVNSNLGHSLEALNSGQNRRIFGPA